MSTDLGKCNSERIALRIIPECRSDSFRNERSASTESSLPFFYLSLTIIGLMVAMHGQYGVD